MKRINLLASVIVLTLLTFMLTSCGKSEFGLTENTAKLMKLTALNADRDASFTVGSLEVADGEQIEITSDLTKGMIRVELIGTPEEQSIDVLPEMDGEPVLTANLKNSDGASGTIPAGTYLLKATCLEKATGTVQIEVKNY